MKQILSIIGCVFITFNLFAQIKMDVWNKNPNTSRTVTKIKSNQLPKSFESKLPDGSSQIYDRWDVPLIEVETSKGKKYSYKPNAYKARNGVSILTYTENGWEGLHQSKTGAVFSMTPDKIILDSNSNYLKESCGMLSPPQSNKPIEKNQGRTPQMSKLVTADYYNKSIPINKTLAVYVEVANNLHTYLGTALSPSGVSLTKTQNWVTNLFLGVSQIYANEGLNVILNKIYVWETVDPYGYTTVTTSGNGLSLFTPKINSNLPVNPNNTTTGQASYFKHLLVKSSFSNLGGIAYVNGDADGFTPSSNVTGNYGWGTYYRTAFSDIYPPLSTVPTDLTYNWALYCTSHEMGHNCGSKHTQWCGWKLDNGVYKGRLDSCYGGEAQTGSTGECGTTLKASTVSTIMSYCHLRGGNNNMLSNGFGKYPRFAIRSAIDNCSDIPSSSVSQPSVTTSSISSITSTTAVGGGNVTSNGGGSLLSKGVCWAVSPTTPTISNSTTNDGISTGVFTSNITGLAAGTTYNVRAYATNSAGTSYGSVVSFTTSAASVPTLSTSTVSAITQTTATSGGTITTDGGSSITSKGVCWSTSPNPTNSLTTKTSNGSGTASFTSSLTNLLPNTLYYVRAYAVNSVNVGYGNEISFTTSPIVTPTLTTNSVTTFTNNTATMGGNISATGGATVTRRGVCYATTANPDTTKTVVNIGSGIGSFSQSVTGLSQGVTYYVRSFAINSAGISYGTQVSFKTLSVPTVSTTAASSVTTTSFITGGNISNLGGTGLTVSDRGIVYATTQNPTILDTKIQASPPTATATGTYTINLSGLTEGVTYYVRAYATNSYGTGYGTQITVRTLSPPVLTTNTISAITSTSFTSGGNITSTGGTGITVTERGIVYSTSTGPTTSNTKVISSATTNSYSMSVTGLNPGTTYFVKAYAINSIGTGYGAERTVTTPSIPVLTTAQVTSVSTTTATSGGTITSSVGSSVSARGVCYSTTPGPTISNTKTSNGTGTGTFSSSLTGLSPSTTYYVRAYATNSTGTGYGDEITFSTTSSGSQPTVTTTTATGISQTTASSGGNVTADGGSTVTARGICYNTSIDPTISNTVINSGTGTGIFTTSLSGLSPNTTYYIRAFATNSNGTNYGSNVSFTTLPPTTKPILSTGVVSSITTTSAIVGGNVTSDGGLTVTTRGICYSTTQNPTTSNNIVSSGSGIGSFSATISGLISGVTYYARAYATNSAGTEYGQQVSFSTLTFPTVSTTNPTNILSNSATIGGDITSDGGSTITAKGVCYATTANPDLTNFFTTNGTGSSPFSASITSLSSNTTYYVRAYATNSVGTSFGNQISFTTTSSGTIPILTTSNVTAVTSTSASSGGDVTNAGSQSVSSRGVVWSTSSTPTVDLATKTSDGTGTGQYTSTITPLTPSTTYYVRAYATSSVGTGYGQEIQFTTSSLPSTSCEVSNLSAYKSNSIWYYKWNINPNCPNYTVSLSRYNSYTNSATPPPVGTTPNATGVRLTNYVPTSSEITQGFVDKQMSSPPQTTGMWYSVDVKCNATTCSGPNTTKSFFYVP